MKKHDARPASEGPEAPCRSEARRIGARRLPFKLPDAVHPSDTIGLALSGGGIRSATFSLGVLQALARMRVLECIDYLSTVSGGGYIGAFFTSIFARGSAATRTPTHPYDVLRGSYSKPPEASAPGAAPGSELWWLRNSGRYLAPTGAGDYIYAVAMQIRNWVAVHLVLGVAILLLAGPLISLDALLQGLLRHALGATGVRTGAATVGFGSGLAAASIALALCWLVPAGFAFFACQMPRPDTAQMSSPYWWRSMTTAVFTLAIVVFAVTSALLCTAVAPVIARSLGQSALGPLMGRLPEYTGSALLSALCALVAVVLALALVLLGIAARAVDAGRYQAGSRAVDPATRAPGLMQSTRVVLTKWLAAALKAVLTTALCAATVALSHYVVVNWSSLWHALAAAGGLGGALTLIVHQVSAFLNQPSKSSWLKKIPLGVLALGAGLALLSLLVLAWFCLAWGAIVVIRGLALGDMRELLDYAAPLAGLTLFMLAIGLAVALSFQFLNMSTLQSLYSSRLTRAYLGATNPARERGADARWTRISDVHPADDLQLDRYYDPANGAPVHLVNVTLNETVSPTDPLVQRDRHGRPVALTPDHICVDGDFKRLPRVAASGAAPAPHPAAHHRSPLLALSGQRLPESMSVGSWISISGAAFSTGVGRQTSLGKSLLLGLANVRLGHWWYAGNLALDSPKSGIDLALRAIARVFQTQAYLAAELFARFSGRYARYWYLSDGGHFENTGLYELLRREVGLIIASDNGADPDYAADDVANMMRLARLDFGCEFVELAPRMLRPFAMVAPLADWLLTLDAAGRGHYQDSACMRILWAYRPVRDGTPTPADQQRGSVIVILKPRLVRNATLDVRQYASLHETFPQETTADQFFTEEQWESYRKLGDVVASGLKGLAGLPAAAPIDALRALAGLSCVARHIALSVLADPRVLPQSTPAFEVQLRDAMRAVRSPQPDQASMQAGTSEAAPAAPAQPGASPAGAPAT
jgi:hypothetical protein